MSKKLELNYFNTFWVKKMSNVVSSNSGSGPTPVAPYQNVPADYQAVPATDWYIEESRIRRWL